MYLFVFALLFQSTLLQEERLFPLKVESLLVLNFNPRSYKRSDVSIFQIIINCGLFQSTLLQEERQSHSSIPIPFILISIHAPTRGATTKNNCRLLLKVFQSTLLQEERHLVKANYLNSNDFNPRSYKRSDGKNAQLSLYLSVIIIA